jgi:hypothetical protein
MVASEARHAQRWRKNEAALQHCDSYIYAEAVVPTT